MVDPMFDLIDWVNRLVDQWDGEPVHELERAIAAKRTPRASMDICSVVCTVGYWAMNGGLESAFAMSDDKYAYGPLAFESVGLSAPAQIMRQAFSAFANDSALTGESRRKGQDLSGNYYESLHITSGEKRWAESVADDVEIKDMGYGYYIPVARHLLLPPCIRQLTPEDVLECPLPPFFKP